MRFGSLSSQVLHLRTLIPSQLTLDILGPGDRTNLMGLP